MGGEGSGGRGRQVGRPAGGDRGRPREGAVEPPRRLPSHSCPFPTETPTPTGRQQARRHVGQVVDALGQPVGRRARKVAGAVAHLDVGARVRLAAAGADPVGGVAHNCVEHLWRGGRWGGGGQGGGAGAGPWRLPARPCLGLLLASPRSRPRPRPRPRPGQRSHAPPRGRAGTAGGSRPCAAAPRATAARTARNLKSCPPARPSSGCACPA
jgi:hypothetical protein